MPLYDYTCQNCGHRFEHNTPYDRLHTLPECVACGADDTERKKLNRTRLTHGMTSGTSKGGPEPLSSEQVHPEEKRNLPQVRLRNVWGDGCEVGVRANGVHVIAEEHLHIRNARVAGIAGTGASRFELADDCDCIID